jgi:hypothetical protein
VNDLLAEAAVVDPKWARREGRRILWVKAWAVITVVAILASTFAIVVGVHNETKLTKFEHSACALSSEQPDNRKAFRECAQIRANVNRTEPIENPCISYQRVTGDQGQNCPRRFITPQEAP